MLFTVCMLAVLALSVRSLPLHARRLCASYLQWSPIQGKANTRRSWALLHRSCLSSVKAEFLTEERGVCTLYDFSQLPHSPFISFCATFRRFLIDQVQQCSQWLIGWTACVLLTWSPQTRLRRPINPLMLFAAPLAFLKRIPLSTQVLLYPIAHHSAAILQTLLQTLLQGHVLFLALHLPHAQKAFCSAATAPRAHPSGWVFSLTTSTKTGIFSRVVISVTRRVWRRHSPV